MKKHSCIYLWNTSGRAEVFLPVRSWPANRTYWMEEKSARGIGHRIEYATLQIEMCVCIDLFLVKKISSKP
ncbi:hypothetical protein CRP01_13765 [Flavilitoribacter nigricans DSM 23189 = NBRC 102662]|uniref:Uncharacterized protein n=1 Tax=Flavilitoribacter nigricans (strain ATCC 23147 / DSM 23189 / NBRC 102662 / NCIMB 1420 / SS-2) TaxID=1122177 RepID=A0A2D0NBZ5_FLAN2|nr:hypothetical protein CRP01_13765 [Flavilitoribacter nigricans DSM 23189 = NBRC 102662]